MTDIEVLVDLFGEIAAGLHNEIEGMDQSALDWRPDPEANSIGITVWHVARWMDVLGARILQDLPAEREQWHVQGWAARTGYDPRGIGSAGLGTITGYTQDEVAAVPSLSADDLLAYLTQSHRIADERLRELPFEALYRPVPGSTVQATLYERLKRLLKGFYGHIGEIQALKAMWARLASSTLSN